MSDFQIGSRVRFHRALTGFQDCEGTVITAEQAALLRDEAGRRSERGHASWIQFDEAPQFTHGTYQCEHQDLTLIAPPTPPLDTIASIETFLETP